MANDPNHPARYRGSNERRCEYCFAPLLDGACRNLDCTRGKDAHRGVVAPREGIIVQDALPAMNEQRQRAGGSTESPRCPKCYEEYGLNASCACTRRTMREDGYMNLPKPRRVLTNHQVRTVDEALSVVREELLQALEKHGPMRSAHEAFGVIYEEFNVEFAKAMHENDREQQLRELQQVAAMAVRAMVDLS